MTNEDFGLAKIVRRKAGRLNQRYEMTGETGSTRYMCPEVAMQLPYNEKVNVGGRCPSECGGEVL